MSIDTILGPIALFSGIVAAGKLIGQSIQKSAKNPVYELKLDLGEKVMTDLGSRIHELENKVTECDKSTNLTTHAVNNLLARFSGYDHRLDKIFSLLNDRKIHP